MITHSFEFALRLRSILLRRAVAGSDRGHHAAGLGSLVALPPGSASSATGCAVLLDAGTPAAAMETGVSIG